MKRGSDVGSRQKRSSNEADALCAMPRSSQPTVTSKTCRTPAMNGARKGPSVEFAFGVRYQFLNGTTQPDASGSADSPTPPITIGMRAPACVRSTARSPVCHCHRSTPTCSPRTATVSRALWAATLVLVRSEEHTSELQSHVNLVCRLLLEKKKKNLIQTIYSKKKKKKYKK